MINEGQKTRGQEDKLETSLNTLSHKGRGKVKVAFTLTEVLITLGILGIVAAMTLPSLVQKYRNKVLINKAKKTYNIISNALVAYSNDVGTPYEYTLIFDSSNSNDNIQDEFAKYFQTLENCTNLQISSGKCGGNYLKRVLAPHIQNYGRLVLKDGSFVTIIRDNTSSGTCFYEWTNYSVVPPQKRTSSRCGRIYFDVNGLKKPNVYGQDIFEIEIFAKKFVALDSLHSALNGGLDNALIKDDL
ncbi:type II secretion system protein [bacterium]|nr:type II secretion system protein [bacterium]